MSILGLVTGAASILGGLFGGGDDKQTIDQTTNTSGQQGQITSGAQTQGTVNSGLSETAQTGTSTGSTTGTTTNTGRTSETSSQTRNLLEQLTSALSGQTNQAQTSTQYSADVLDSINSLLKSGLGSGNYQAATSGLAGRLEAVMQESARPAFDVDAYASGISGAAAARLGSDLESNINKMLSATGSSETGNSMSALLANRMRNDTAANLAGIQSDAVAKGQQIRDQQQMGISQQVQGLSGALSGAITSLLGTTAGAQGTVQGQTQTTQNTRSNTSQTGGTTGTTTGTTQNTQVQSILEQLTQALNSQQGTVGTSGSIGTNRSATMGTADQTSHTKGTQTGGGGGSNPFSAIGDIFKSFGDSAAAA